MPAKKATPKQKRKFQLKKETPKKKLLSTKEKKFHLLMIVSFTRRNLQRSSGSMESACGLELEKVVENIELDTHPGHMIVTHVKTGFHNGKKTLQS